MTVSNRSTVSVTNNTLDSHDCVSTVVSVWILVESYSGLRTTPRWL